MSIIKECTCSITWVKYQKEHAIKFIRSKFEKEGYKLLTTEYKNNQQKLDYICPKGHRHSITWVNWQQGCRCLFCTTWEYLWKAGNLLLIEKN